MSTKNRTTTRYSRKTTLRTTEVIGIESFNILKELGNGAYGTVYLAEKKDTKQLFALKELSKQFIMKHDKLSAVFRERDILE